MPLSLDLFKKRLYHRKFSHLPALYLNLGCGADHKPGWVNIDDGSHFGQKGLDVRHNLARGIPFADSTADAIYNEHLIEHLTKKQGLKFLQECHRVLKAGGILRIACPDLEDIIADYLNDAFHERQWLKEVATQYQGKSRCELLNISMRDWGHQYMYNFDDLKQNLIDAGFKAEHITRCEVAKSAHQALCGLETRDDSLVIEAVKHA